MCASMKFSVRRRAMCTQVDNSGKRIRPPLGIYGEFELDIGSGFIGLNKPDKMEGSL